MEIEIVSDARPRHMNAWVHCLFSVYLWVGAFFPSFWFSYKCMAIPIPNRWRRHLATSWMALAQRPKGAV